jgi:hypothetical protein
VTSWSFLTSHARVLPCIARDPGARLRDLAASPGITGRSAHGIVTGLAEAGYVIRQKDGRRTAIGSWRTCRCPSPAPGNPHRRGRRPLRSPGPARIPAGRRHTPQSRNGQSATQTPAGAPAPADGSLKKVGHP